MIKLKKRIGNWFPINDHYTYNFLTKKQPWLIDELYL